MKLHLESAFQSSAFTNNRQPSVDDNTAELERRVNLKEPAYHLCERVIKVKEKKRERERRENFLSLERKNYFICLAKKGTNLPKQQKQNSSPSISWNHHYTSTTSIIITTRRGRKQLGPCGLSSSPSPTRGRRKMTQVARFLQFRALSCVNDSPQLTSVLSPT